MWSRFEPGTARMQVRNVTSSAMLLAVTRFFALLKAEGVPAIILYSYTCLTQDLFSWDMKDARCTVRKETRLVSSSR